jgi:PAS domain S-box-containing protein
MGIHRSNVVPLSAAIVMALLVAGAWHMSRITQENDLRNETENTLTGVATRLEDYIKSRLAAGKQIRNHFLSGRIKNNQNFQEEIFDIVELYPDVQAVNFIDKQGIIRWTAPYKGNEKAVGIELKKLPLPRTVLAEVEQTKQLRVTPPFNLKLGGKGFVVVLPLLKDESIAGFIGIVFRIKPLLGVITDPSISEFYRLLIRDQKIAVTNPQELLAPNLEVVSNEIKIGNRPWHLSLMPNLKKLEASSTIIDELILIIGLTFTVLAATFIKVFEQRRIKLGESGKQFRTLIESASQGILVHRYHKPLFANQALVDMYGYDSIEDLMSLESTKCLIRPDYIKGNHEKVLQENDFTATTAELIGIRKNGTEVWVERRSILIPWDDETAICSIRLDISDRKNAEEQIHESQEKVNQEHDRLNEAINSFKDGFALFDADDKLVVFNDNYHVGINNLRRILKPGMSFEEIIRKSVEYSPQNIGVIRDEAWIQNRLKQHRNPSGPLEREMDCLTSAPMEQISGIA